MPYTKNTIFYVDFLSNDGYTYTLEFIPGDVTTLSTPERVQFPTTFIFNNLVVDSGFDTDVIPNGLAKGSILTLSLDMSQAQGDWIDVANWILRGKSETTIDFYGDKYVNNIWLLTTNKNIYPVSVPVWAGIQDKKPESKLKIGIGVAKIDLTVLGIEKPLLERISLTDVQFTHSAPAGVVNQHCPIRYLDGTKTIVNVHEHKRISQNDYTFHTASIDTIGTAFDTALANNIAILTRGRLSILHSYFKHLFDYVNIFERNFLKSGLDGTAHLASAASVITHIYDANNNLIGGLFDKNDANGWATNYSNLWELYKGIAEQHLLKITFRYFGEPGNDYFQILTQPAIDFKAHLGAYNFGIESNLKVLSLASGSVMADEIELSVGDGIIFKGVGYNKGVDGSGQAQAIESEGTGADDSYEADIIIGTQFADDFTRAEKTTANNEIIYNDSLPVNTYYYFADAFLPGVFAYGSPFLTKYNEHSTLQIQTTINGGSNIVIDDLDVSEYAFLAMPSFNNDMNALVSNFKYTANIRNQVGVSANLALAALKLWGNEKQAGTEFEVPAFICSVNNLGEEYSLEFGAVISAGLDIQVGNKAIIHSVNWDVIKGVSKIKIFIRGDEWA